MLRQKRQSASHSLAFAMRLMTAMCSQTFIHLTCSHLSVPSRSLPQTAGCDTKHRVQQHNTCSPLPADKVHMAPLVCLTGPVHSILSKPMHTWTSTHSSARKFVSAGISESTTYQIRVSHTNVYTRTHRNQVTPGFSSIFFSSETTWLRHVNYPSSHEKLDFVDKERARNRLGGSRPAVHQNQNKKDRLHFLALS